MKAKITENRLVRFWDHYLTDGQYPHLFRVDLASRKVTDLTPGSARYMGLTEIAGGYDIAPDGTELAFSANATEPPYATMNYDVFTVKLPGGAPASVTQANLADDSAPRYTPDGRFIVYGRQTRPGGSTRTSRDSCAATADRERSSELAPAFDAQATDWTIVRAATASCTSTPKTHGKVSVYAVPRPGGRPRVVVQRRDDGKRGRCTRKGVLVYTPPDPCYPRRGCGAREPDGTGQRALTSFNEAKMKALDLGRTEDTRFKGAGGDDVQMFVVTPPGFDPAAGRTWPLVQLHPRRAPFLVDRRIRLPVESRCSSPRAATSSRWSISTGRWGRAKRSRTRSSARTGTSRSPTS